MREGDDKTKRDTRLRQEYHPHLFVQCTPVRGRVCGACARIDGRASLPGRAGPRKAALHALSVLFSFARISVQRVTFVLISSSATADPRSYSVKEDRRVSIVIARPVARSAPRRAGDTPVADRKKNA